MQKYLYMPNDMTLDRLTQLVGSQNVDMVLAVNGISRTKNIGAEVESRYRNIRQNYSSEDAVSNQRRYNLLNDATGDYGIFESTALLDDEGWKYLDTYGSLPHYIIIPDTVDLPLSNDILNSGEATPKSIYTQVIDLVKTGKVIDPNIFNRYVRISDKTVLSNPLADRPNITVFQNFRIPWGKISLFSSLSNSSIDFPVYPEEINDSRGANYNTMPNLLYQYEPWQLYQSSGPRDNQYTFKFHRDMWTGDHRDGKANELIRFCEANCYPDFNGSTVNTSDVTLYIHGKPLISGVMKQVSHNLYGPIGLDGMPLACDLTIQIIEVSKIPLNYNTVKNLPLIG